MYSAEYLTFVAKQQLPIEVHSLIERLAEAIPASGCMDKTIPDLANKVGCSSDELSKVVNLLSVSSPQLVRNEGNILIFDYLNKDINYVHHLRNARSNFGFEQQEFL